MSQVPFAANRIERLVAPVLSRLPRGLVRFLGVGCGGLAVDLIVLVALERLGTPKYWARLVSLGLATLFTWALNRRYTFRGDDARPHAELVRYTLVALSAQGFNYGIFIGVSDLFPRMPHAIAAFIGAVAATGLSYTGQRFFTFGQRRAEIDA